MSGHHFAITADELISSMKRSNLKHKTWLLVEDKTSESTKEPYRFIRSQLGEKFEVFSCFGKENLMRIFERKSELEGINVVFYRDRDFYVHVDIPKEYDEIIFTTGYSIENDLCAHTDIESKLLLPEEQISYRKAASSFIRWYSTKVHFHLNGSPSNYDISPFTILNQNYEIKQEYLPTNEELNASKLIYEEILKDYIIKLRGHSLFSLFVLFSNTKERSIKYNYQGIAKYCVNELSPPLLVKSIYEIEAKHK